MKVSILHDKDTILNYLSKNRDLQAYCIGDLDDFFWPKTIWYGLVDGISVEAIALVYVGMETPTLLLFYDKDKEWSYQLLNRIKNYLPKKFFTHLSPGLIDVFGEKSITANFGLHYKMALKRPLQFVNDQNIIRLEVNDLQIIQEFYNISYPENWFDKRMLETGKYFGYFVDKKLVGVAGIHVYSELYKVAALGNIATHPEYRGRQICYKLTTNLCCDLQKTVDSIGLNVKANNQDAINCYKNIGFEVVGQYDECLISL